MSLSNWIVSSRICSSIPLFTRAFADTTLQRPIARLPAPSGSIKTPENFLKAIGRSAETKVSAENWKALWQLKGQDLRKAGLAVRDRRYILWCMEKYRLGLPIPQFAHEPSPKKIVRGWGPKVQDGKRIRSKRIKNKQK